MKKIFWILGLVFMAVVFFQCRKAVGYEGTGDPGVPVLPDPITASLQGNVVDENNLPAAGVNVSLGTMNALTDANGYFRFTNAPLDKNTTLITAQKKGYFKGYRVFAATSGCNQVFIKLAKRNLAGTVSSSSGGDVSLSNGAKITLPANGIVIASSNTPYSGNVNVYASYIDPKSSDISKTVPGSFVANDKNGKRVILSSYGMLAVELESAGGEKLQIKDGNTATVNIPISASTLSSAPATISLWYVNDSTGIWQEEGTATKQGNNYVGTVKHFTYWNADFANPAVEMSFTLQTPNGTPIANTGIEVFAVDSSGYGHGYTDSLGQASGLVPLNTQLKLEVYGPCGVVVYSQNLPGISTTTDLGILKINIPSQYFFTLTGTILNCSGMPVTNGAALINFEGYTRYASTDTNGIFTTNYITCGSLTPISIIGIDNGTSQQSSLTTIPVTLPITNAGSISACGTSTEQYVNYNLDGNNYSITNVDSEYIYFDGGRTILEASSQTGNYRILLYTPGSALGTFPVSYLEVNSYKSRTLIQPFNIIFTDYPTVIGEYYEGSFSGQFIDNAQVTHTISSTFRIRKNY